MDTYILNLPKETRRRHHMEKLMETLGITNYQFVSPITIDDNDVGSSLIKSQRSLNETNILLLEKVYNERKSEYVLVFEDDASLYQPLHGSLIPKLNHLIEMLPSDWDMLYLEYCNETCIFTSTVTSEVSKAHSPVCSAAILYNVEKLDKVINVLKKDRYNKPIDNTYRKEIYSKNINAYIVTPPIFIQDMSFDSTIKQYLGRILFGYQSCNTKKIVLVLLGILLVIFVLIYFRHNIFLAYKNRFCYLHNKACLR
jgi:GR25 family glycosyltransferase involved in LPS biosynthesis